MRTSSIGRARHRINTNRCQPCPYALPVRRTRAYTGAMKKHRHPASVGPILVVLGMAAIAIVVFLNNAG